MRASERAEVRRYERHVNPQLVRLLGVLGYGRLFVRAAGARLTDHEGREYLDALAGYGTVAAGHHAPRLRERLERALSEEPWGEREEARAQELRARLGELSGLGAVVYGASGAEAVDTALQLARAATGRAGVVSCERGYHGLNLGALSLQGEARMRAPFEPLLPGFRRVPFGDLRALEAALGRGDVGAFVVEPMQIEGGMAEPPAGYLAAARELCARGGALLVMDEIQAGLGRTGHLFAWQAEQARPDVLVLGKALGGSYAALSAALTRPEVLASAEASGAWAPPRVAGVNVASAVALEQLDLLERGGLIEAARERGGELLAGVKRRLAGHRLVRAVRGRGLLVGIELSASGWRLPLPDATPPPLANWISLRLLEEGVICQPTTHGPDVLRLEPPLSITPPEVTQLLDRLAKVFAECSSVPAVLRALAWRLGQQAARRWSF